MRAQHKEDRQVRKRQKEQLDSQSNNNFTEREKDNDENSKKVNKDNTSKKLSTTSKMVRRASKRKSVNGGSI